MNPVKSQIMHFIRNFKKTYVIVPTIFAVVGLFFVFITPPLWGVDEITHFVRVYQVSQGGIRAAKVGPNEIGGDVPANVNKLQGIVYKDLLSMKPAGTFIERNDYSHDSWYHPLIDKPLSNEKQFVNFPGSASYSPVVYIPPAIGIDIAMLLHFSLQWVIFIGRIFCLGTTVTALWYILRRLDAYRTKWIFVAVSLLPMVVYQSSIISADGVTSALSLLVVGLFLKGIFKRRFTRAEFIILLVAAVLLPLCKFNYGILSVLILFIPRQVIRSSFPNIKKPRLLLWLTIGLAVLLAGVWLYMVRDVGDVTGKLYFGSRTVDAGMQIHYVFTHPINFLVALLGTIVISGSGYIQGMIGLLGWNFISVPTAILITSSISLILAAMWARSEIVKNKKIILYSSLLSVVCALSIFGALYLAFSPVGDHKIEGVQGRYFLPVLVPLVAGIALLLPGEVRGKEKHFGTAILTLSLIGLLTAMFYYAESTY